MRNHVIGAHPQQLKLTHPQQLKLTCPYCACLYFSATAIKTHERTCHAKAKFQNKKIDEYFDNLVTIDESTMDLMIGSGEYNKEYLWQLVAIAKNEQSVSMINTYVLEIRANNKEVKFDDKEEEEAEEEGTPSEEEVAEILTTEESSKKPGFSTKTEDKKSVLEKSSTKVPQKSSKKVPEKSVSKKSMEGASEVGVKRQVSNDERSG